MVNWTDIHPKFTEELQNEWEEKGFGYQITKQWKEILGEVFEPKSNWAFCVWLRDEKKLNPLQIQETGNLENLRTEYNKLWEDTHEGFVEITRSGRLKRLVWEAIGFTYPEAQQWIQAGFKPNDFWKVKQWKSFGFTPQQAKAWREIGLTELNDLGLATYLRGKNYQPSPDLNLEQLRKEHNSWEKNPVAQEYLDIIIS